MKQKNRLSTWQIALIVLGALLIGAPIVWDILKSTFTSLADVELEEIFTRGGMFVVGLILLSIVGIVEIVKDSRKKPGNKYIK